LSVGALARSIGEIIELEACSQHEEPFGDRRAMVEAMTATAACSHRGFIVPAFERRTDWRSLLLGAPPTRT
jgi:hypothetical protein